MWSVPRRLKAQVNLNRDSARLKTCRDTSVLKRIADFPHFFRFLPQAIRNVHRIRTARVRIVIAKFFWMRESALTAGVDVTLPVIAQGWFCSS